MGNARSKDKELIQRDMEERRERQEIERKRKEEEEERKRREQLEQKLDPLIILHACCRGFLARKTLTELLELRARRKNIAKEILSTEHSYVSSLKVLIALFYKPLSVAAQYQTDITIRSFKKRKHSNFGSKEDIAHYYENSTTRSNSISSSSLNVPQHSHSTSSLPDTLETSNNNNNNNNNNEDTLDDEAARLRRAATLESLTEKTSLPSGVPDIPGLTKEDVKVIFSQIEVIQLYNQTIEDQLQKRVSDWDWTTELGDIFLGMVDFLKAYVQYVNNYNNSIEKLEKLQENAKFTQWLRQTEAKPECNRNNISSFLIMPIQRIPRYVLLLEDMVKVTPPNHIDHPNLVEALNRMKEVAKEINDKKRKQESFKFTLDLYHRLEPTVTDLCEAHRYFIKEGTLKEEGKVYCVYLFSDILLLAKDTNNHKLRLYMHITLETAEVTDVADSKTHKIKNTFQIRTPRKTILVTAKTLQEKQEWMSAIADRIQHSITTTTTRTRLSSTASQLLVTS